ncbi:MAG: hypothetical protein E6I56_09675 [Chloroflexi bacterium]|nr:MAG: hypothetical protein E6I56_09675 [Chloroflexota bacterium]
MINEIRSNARSIDNPKVARPTSDRSPHKHGIAGALLGATWFGAAFPLMVTAVAGVVGAADAAVYVASGMMFGAISGGTIGAVIGGRGR